MPTIFKKQKVCEKKRDHCDSIPTNEKHMLVKLTQDDGVSFREACRALKIYNCTRNMASAIKLSSEVPESLHIDILVHAKEPLEPLRSIALAARRFRAII